MFVPSLTRMSFFVLAVPILLLAGCGKDAPKEKNYFHVQEGKLQRENKDWTLRSIYTPNLMSASMTHEERWMAAHRAAEVGGGNLCFDLQGLSADGKSIAPESLALFYSIVKDATDRHFGSVVRVFGEGATLDPAVRLEAAKTVATTLKDTPQAMLLFLDNDSELLAAEIKKIAPALVVAAPKGGAVTVVKSASEFETAPRPALIWGGLPADATTQVHFILPPDDSSYAALDAALADPRENEPWIPDNSSLTEQEKAEGWIALFDGKTLNGWMGTGSNPNGWQVKDGCVERTEEGAGSLRTLKRFSDFILKADWMIGTGGNSGIHLRSPRAARASRVGMEIQIMGDHGQPLNESSTGSVYLQAAPPVDATKPEMEWNSYEIHLQGDLLKVWLNGQIVQDLDLTQHPDLKLRIKSGFIALTDHNHFVSYKNVKIKPL